MHANGGKQLWTPVLDNSLVFYKITSRFACFPTFYSKQLKKSALKSQCGWAHFLLKQGLQTEFSSSRGQLLPLAPLTVLSSLSCGVSDMPCFELSGDYPAISDKILSYLPDPVRSGGSRQKVRAVDMSTPVQTLSAGLISGHSHKKAKRGAFHAPNTQNRLTVSL